MSSPVDHTDLLLAQDEGNLTFQQPPAVLNSNADNSIVVKEAKNHSEEHHVDIDNDNDNDNNNNNNTNDVNEEDQDDEEYAGASQLPITLTQPILSDHENADEKDKNDKNDVNNGDHNAYKVTKIELKGQPVWQLEVDGIILIKRIDDMRFNFAPILELIRKLHDDDDKINKLIDDIKNKFMKDESGDLWISQDSVVSISSEYSIDKYLNPLLVVSTDENSKKRNNSEVNVLESPTKKSKLESKNPNLYAENLNDNLDIKTYTHDLVDGNPNFPFTLKPLSEENEINEHSKVIISSLFLPFQSEVTLDQVLKNEAGFLSSQDGSNDDDMTSIDHNNIDKVEIVGNTINVKDIKQREVLESKNKNEHISLPGATNVKDEISAHPGMSKTEINIDVPIDDNGQTALHLAATLGKVSLVKELIEKGANRFRGDNDGQTALIRVVHATNCFELSCFDKLIDLLYPSILLLDNRGRTILHHIALNCGLKGRYDSSKYYLETLLEWVVKKGSTLPNDSSLTLTNFIKEVVNKSDKYGNTCLNYATLSGNKYIVSQLLEICADPSMANKVGVTPGDWGIDVNNSNANNSKFYEADKSLLVDDFNNKRVTNTNNILDNNGTTGGPNINILHINNNKNKNNDNDNNKVDDKRNLSIKKEADGGKPNNDENNDKISLSGTDFKESTNSLQLLDSIQSFISNLGNDFRKEITQKSQQIEKLNPILREKTLQLSQKRKQYDELQKMVRKISKITNKIDNLNKAIDEEEEKFQEEVKNLRINISEDNYLGNFDADQPFTILPIYQDVEEIIERLLDEKIKRISKDDKTEVKNENGDNNDVDVVNKNGNEGDVHNVSGDTIIKILNSIKASDILPHYEKQLTEEKRETLKKEIPPAVVLDARIRAYEKNNKILMDRMNNKRNSNKELESQFKRIIGLCIGTDTNNIDDRLLSSLLMSVENDPDPEIGQIKKVLKIVGDLDNEESVHGSPLTRNTNVVPK